MAEEWLLVKRGLYYRPNDCGYTGIRDHAGRYSYEEAKARARDGVSMIEADKAPEFSAACFNDLAHIHLERQRNAARAENERLRAVLRGYEQWEADLVINNDWDGKDGLPTLTQDEYDRLMELQADRNAVLGKADEQVTSKAD